MSVLMFAGLILASQSGVSEKVVAPQPPKERVICRSVVITGSRFEKRSCRTQKGWNDLAEKSGDFLRDIQSKPEFNGPEGPPPR